MQIGTLKCQDTMYLGGHDMVSSFARLPAAYAGWSLPFEATLVRMEFLRFNLRILGCLAKETSQRGSNLLADSSWL